MKTLLLISIPQKLGRVQMNSPEHKSNILNKDFKILVLVYFQNTQGFESNGRSSNVGSVHGSPIVMKGSFTTKTNSFKSEQRFLFNASKIL